MIIKKGEKITVHDKRKGKYLAIAGSDIDTDRDDWYDVILDQDFLWGAIEEWRQGDKVPARSGLSFISPRK